MELPHAERRAGSHIITSSRDWLRSDLPLYQKAAKGLQFFEDGLRDLGVRAECILCPGAATESERYAERFRDSLTYFCDCIYSLAQQCEETWMQNLHTSAVRRAANHFFQERIRGPVEDQAASSPSAIMIVERCRASDRNDSALKSRKVRALAWLPVPEISCRKDSTAHRQAIQRVPTV